MIQTKIEYCDSTVNPIVGCTGCELYSRDPKKNHCYAASMVRRWAGQKGWPERFTSPIHVPGRLEKAIGWPDLTGTERPDKPWLGGYPRIIFVNDLGDGFCPDVDPFGWLLWNDALDAMEASPHIYLLLTKWPQRMAEFFRSLGGAPDNFWLGTSVPAQDYEWRVPTLLDIKGGLKWLSLEPLLRPIDLVGSYWWDHRYQFAYYKAAFPDAGPPIGWVTYGGESGLNARPAHPERFRSLRDQLKEADVPQFFKQWGAWICPVVGGYEGILPKCENSNAWDGETGTIRVGRKAAGRLLDGREHNEMPGRRQQ